ncbi:MAG: DNA polymerase II [Desulfurococcaceae archaeon]
MLGEFVSKELLTFYVLDVSYEVVGKEPHIIIWAISRNERRVLLRDRRFRPYFYAILHEDAELDNLISRVKACSKPSSPIISVEVVERKYFGKPVKALKITTVIPEYVREYREAVSRIPGVREVVEADIRFSMRYSIDNDIHPCQWHVAEVVKLGRGNAYRVDDEYEVVGFIKSIEDTAPPKSLRLLAFDIEVYSPGYPRPERDPVIVISLVNDRGEVRQLTARDKDDRGLILEFVDYVKKYDPDIILGYNSNRFDWVYLINRAKHLGIKLDVGRKVDGEPRQSTYGHISIPGRLSVDLYDYAEEITEIKVKSLDVVADYLGVMKRGERTLINYTDIPVYWDNLNLRSTLLKYAMEDAVSTYGIGEKMLPFAMQLASITGLPLDQVGSASVGNRLENYLMREAYKIGELAPNREERPYESYKGAIVLSPKRGIHSNIAVLDFSSMYPNIMMKYNIGPDTYAPMECNPDSDYIAPEVRHCFKKAPEGFFKKVLTKLIDLRRAVREELKKHPPESPEYRLLNERQRALKILANASYGYMGWIGARWYCKEGAEAVTAWGRETIMKAVEEAKRLGLEVIYGDTDSLFVKHDEAKVKKLIDYVESELGFDIKIDKIYVRVFFTEAKKRYVGLMTDGRIDIVGFEAVRGDWAEIAKEVQERIVEILLKEMSVDKAVEYVRNVISDLKANKIPLEKLVIWKTLTKALDEYEVDAPHVVAAQKLMKMGYRVSVGDKIGYVVTKGVGKVSTKVEPAVLVKEYGLIDVSYYIDRQVIPAALRILGYFGVTEQQLKSAISGQKSIFEYFGKK